MKAYFITKINTAKNQDDINKIIDEAQRYIKLKEYKENLKNQIKNIYGNYVSESPLAQKVMSEIDLAKSIDEAGNIYLANLEKLKEDAKQYYISKYRNEVVNSKYVRVMIDNREYLYTTDNFLKALNNYDLETLKNLKLYKVTMCEATLPVLASYCGNLPKPGDKIIIYEFVNFSKKNIIKLKDEKKLFDYYKWYNIPKNETINKGSLPIPISEAIVKDVYVIFPLDTVSYSESKSSKVTISQDDDTTSASKDVNINYQLTGISNILHAAVMGKIDYNTLRYKLRDYGYRLNKLEEDTQIFDPNVVYLLVVEIPSDRAPEIIGLDLDKTAIVKIKE
ncbi:conserved protein of unknown function [Methanocaldococcus lauensis]|nr:conserved protein of unknown function [Methanocaldococcus lauensis]